MDETQYKYLVEQASKLLNNSSDFIHDLSHAKRVEAYAFRIRDELKNKRSVDKKLLSIIALWHDISHAFYKYSLSQFVGEAKRTVKIFKKYAAEIHLSKKETNIISEAILYHGLTPKFSFSKTNTIYYKILQDADNLDGYNKERHKRKKGNVPGVFHIVTEKVFLPFGLRFAKQIKNSILILDESKRILAEEYSEI